MVVVKEVYICWKKKILNKYNLYNYINRIYTGDTSNSF